MGRNKSRIFRMEKVDGKTYRVMYYYDPRIKAYRRSQFAREVKSGGMKKPLKKLPPKTQKTKPKQNVAPKQQPVRQQQSPPPQQHHQSPPQQQTPRRKFGSHAATRLIDSYTNLGRR